MSDPWTIVESRFDPATAKAYEGLFTLGSGYLHVRGSFEEHLDGQPQNVEYERRAGNVTSEKFRDVLAQWGTYVPGVFAKHPTLNNQMVNLPWPLGLAVTVEGERLDVVGSGVLEYRRELRMRTATLFRRVVWTTKCGARVTVEWERFVSAARPHLIVQRLRIGADRACQVAVTASIEGDARTNGYWHLARVETAASADRGSHSCSIVTDAGDSVSMRSGLFADRTSAGFDDYRVHTSDRCCSVTIEGRLTPDTPVTFHRRTWISSSRDQKPVDGCQASLSATHAELLSEHTDVWQARWDASDVEIEGDLHSQLATRVALFHLLRAHVPDARVAIDAKGYAGEAYWGRFFWDTEIYLLPFFLYTRPDAARTLVEYRVATLEGARRNARRYGYHGARFAWEADHLGDECCPSWQYADHEVHVTADVAHAIGHFAAAHDPKFLTARAAALLCETARYWMQRLTFDDRRTLNNPRLLGVMGPDEYKPITNQNAYTNRMVAFALDLAATVGGSADATIQELHDWRATASAIKILRDPKRQLVMQCEGFDRLDDPRFDELWTDRSRTFAAHVSQERLYRSKCLKQADVLMLMALFPGEFSDAEVRAAWDYYLPCTTHDSSLSAGIHCLVACRLGLDHDAWSFWRRGSQQDLPAADGGEGATAEGIHIAGAAATWQMIVLGFAGMRTALQADELTFFPRLPAAWQAVRFPLVWKGASLHVEIQRGQTRITNRSASPLPVTVAGVRRVVAPGTTESFA